MFKFYGTIYNRTITTNTLSDLKRKASRIANGYFSAVDKMDVVAYHDSRKYENLEKFTFLRINKKSPNNTIIYGQWR